MVDDDDTGRLIHLDLPLDVVEALAEEITQPPEPWLADAIVAEVHWQANWPGQLAVSPHRVAETLQLGGIGVSVEQVASVMLTRMRVTGPS
jgi:hypothetical protein